MSAPTFDKDGNAFAPAGDTFHLSGAILHPLQKAGVIGLRGGNWSFNRLASVFTGVAHRLSKIPQGGSGEDLR